MQHILVPCDFSKPAIQAFRFALDVARQSKGTVHLVNVIELPVAYDSILMPALNFEQEFLIEMKKKSELEFGKIIAKYNSEGIKVVTKIQFGIVSTMILDYITDQSIDIVFMGSHGVNGFREYLIGSNAEKIVRRSQVPVLVLKDRYKGPIKNIVFPNSLEAENADLMKQVKALQNFFKAHLNIVWINTPLNFTADTITSEHLDSFAKSHKLKDYSLHVFNHPDKEKGILEFTKFIKGDMIAMGTHGRTGIAHLISGSLAEDVANHTNKLVWTYAIKNNLVEA